MRSPVAGKEDSFATVQAGDSLRNISAEKGLGIMASSKLNMSTHCGLAHQKCSSAEVIVRESHWWTAP